jgi:prepilin-type processing-associated H-X9-DG protein
MSLFAGLFFLFMAAIFWSAMDAVKKPEEKPEEMSTANKSGCSLFVKLFVGIFLFGLLVALLLPAIPAAREPARRMQCSNNMKQIMFAFHDYHDKHGHFPPAYSVDENGKPLHSWRVLILPYYVDGRDDWSEKIRFDEPWDSEHNRQFHSVVPSIFLCPSYRSLKSTVPTKGGCNYSIIVGTEAAFSGSEPREMSKETSNTIFVVERRVPVNWMDPSREISFEVACQGINADAMGISSFHPGGVNCAMGDGSVQFLSDSIASVLLLEMLTVK